MDEATYATILDTLTLREIRFQIVKPGCRTQVVTVVTTLTDTKADIAERMSGSAGTRNSTSARSSSR